MGVLLVRHADAIDGGGMDDAERWLTSHGRARARRVAQQVLGKGLPLTRFVTSPRVRAVQTAELFASVLGFEGPIEVVPQLSYTMPASEAVRVLRELSGGVAAFGHMPTIADILQRLTQGEAARGFSPAEAVWVEQGELSFRLASD